MRTLLRLLPMLALVSAMPSQGRPAWTALAQPNGVLPSDVTSIGKLTVCREGTLLHVHSACRREWRTLATSGAATLRLTNDCLLVQDGSTWRAFSAYRGSFEPLQVSPQAQLLNQTGQDNDSILLVHDAGMLHAFSGFHGAWVGRPVGAGFGWSTQRHVAIVSDGPVLAGMDAYGGQWHDLQVQTPPLQLSTDGTAGLAIGTGEVHAFSANSAAWVSAPALPGATFVRNDDWALFYDGSQMLGYSGIQGRFEHAPLGASSIVANEDCFTLVDTVHGLVAYSAIRGAFSAPIAPSTARVRASVAVATLADTTAVHGYSAAHNSFATLQLLPTSEEAAGCLAYAIDGTTGIAHCYSGATGQWHTPPPGVLPGAPLVTTTSALLTTTTGVRAFSARSGRFVPLAANGLTLVGNSSSAVSGAWNSTDLHAFDARAERWISLGRSSSTPLILQIWRTAMFAVDGTVAVGFGAQDGTWATVPMPGPYVTGRANSESSRIVTPNHVIAHAALAELASYAQFPEFRRVQPAGATFRLSLPLRAGDLALLAGGVLGAPTPVAGIGTLQLDQGSITSLLVLPTPGQDRAIITLPIPPNPALVGGEWAFQALVAPLVGSAYLTGPATMLVL
jgi:hypothetical protein